MTALRTLAWGLSLATAHAAHAEPLDLQTGTWEVTTKVSQPSRRIVERYCLPERHLGPLVHGADAIEDDPCHPMGAPKVGRKSWAVGLQCDDGSQIHARFVVDTAQHLSGTVVRVGGKRSLLQKLDLDGRWVRAGCTGRG